MHYTVARGGGGVRFARSLVLTHSREVSPAAAAAAGRVVMVMMQHTALQPAQNRASTSKMGWSVTPRIRDMAGGEWELFLSSRSRGTRTRTRTPSLSPPLSLAHTFYFTAHVAMPLFVLGCFVDRYLGRTSEGSRPAKVPRISYGRIEERTDKTRTNRYLLLLLYDTIGERRIEEEVPFF